VADKPSEQVNQSQKSSIPYPFHQNKKQETARQRGTAAAPSSLAGWPHTSRLADATSPTKPLLGSYHHLRSNIKQQQVNFQTVCKPRSTYTYSRPSGTCMLHLCSREIPSSASFIHISELFSLHIYTAEHILQIKS
jgi:hypothetical protein